MITCLQAAGAQQRATSFAADLTVGEARGRGGEYVDRTLVGARTALSVRHAVRPSLYTFGEVAMDWLSVNNGEKAVCVSRLGGGCLPGYPDFAGPTLSVGVMAQPVSRIEIRAGIGAAAYRASAGPRVGAVVGDIGLALFPINHVGLVLGGRCIVVPSYRGDDLSAAPWMFGVRVR